MRCAAACSAYLAIPCPSKSQCRFTHPPNLLQDETQDGSALPTATLGGGLTQVGEGGRGGEMAGTSASVAGLLPGQTFEAQRRAA